MRRVDENIEGEDDEKAKRKEREGRNENGQTDQALDESGEQPAAVHCASLVQEPQPVICKKFAKS